MLKPDPIHDYAISERVGFIGQPFRKFKPATPLGADLTTAEHLQPTTRYRRAGLFGITTFLDRSIDRSRLCYREGNVIFWRLSFALIALLAQVRQRLTTIDIVMRSAVKSPATCLIDQSTPSPPGCASRMLPVIFTFPSIGLHHAIVAGPSGAGCTNNLRGDNSVQALIGWSVAFTKTLGNSPLFQTERPLCPSRPSM